MTVKELAILLADFSDDMLVVVESGFGGYFWSDVSVPRIVTLKSNDSNKGMPAIAIECAFGDDYEELRSGVL
jgi:hypothetical protein